MLFSPVLPLWFNRGNISWFQEALLFSDPKRCSKMVGVLSHPLGGEQKTKTPALMSVKLPFLSFFADFCQAKAMGFFLEKRKCGSLEGNIVWDTPMSMRIGTCESTLGRKWQCLKEILQSLQWCGDQAAKGSPRRPYTESHFITFKLCCDPDQITPLITFGKERRNSQLPQWPWSKHIQSEKCHTGAIIQKYIFIAMNERVVISMDIQISWSMTCPITSAISIK